MKHCLDTLIYFLYHISLEYILLESQPSLHFCLQSKLQFYKHDVIQRGKPSRSYNDSLSKQGKLHIPNFDAIFSFEVRPTVWPVAFFKIKIITNPLTLNQTVILSSSSQTSCKQKSVFNNLSNKHTFSSASYRTSLRLQPCVLFLMS